MAAIITHDLLAKDIYHETFESVGGSRDEAEAFLLGNQGPDPLFFAGVNVRYLSWRDLGTTIHRARPAEFIMALKAAVPQLPARERSWARAYVLGFVCHYELDRALHPLVYSQTNALCGAGVEGLDEQDASEVHALIETELDELALTAKRGETVASFNPAAAILKGSSSMVGAISRLYAIAVQDAFGLNIPEGLFSQGVGAYRLAQHIVYSPSGWKRSALSGLERLARPHSLLGALSHQAVERTDTPFANLDRSPWRNPFTDEESTADFWELYERARKAALAFIEAIDADDFSLADAHRITADVNFNGEPVVARIMAVEDVEDVEGAPSPC